MIPRRPSPSTYRVPGTASHGLILLHPFDVDVIVTHRIDEEMEIYRDRLSRSEGGSGGAGIRIHVFLSLLLSSYPLC